MNLMISDKICDKNTLTSSFLGVTIILPLCIFNNTSIHLYTFSFNLFFVCTFSCMHILYIKQLQKILQNNYIYPYISLS